jgi:hypothetical protein
MLAYGLLKGDPMGTGGSAGTVLERNLRGLQDLINESLAEMRAELDTQRGDCDRPRDLLGELRLEGTEAANARGLQLTPAESG